MTLPDMPQHLGDTPDRPLWAAVEAGGTKFHCALATADQRIVAETRIPTTTPDETIGAAIDFFGGARDGRGIAGLGIASFGPVELNRASPRWGRILTTPKPGWSNTDLAGRLGEALGVTAVFETDVNGAVLGEWRHGAGRGLSNLAYITVGTGIGAGLIVNGRLVHGRMHPEAGHIRAPRHSADTGGDGICPFHGDCLEGLASGTAIKARYGATLSGLPQDHPAWTAVADYLAHLCAVLTLTMAPDRIVLGGGVMAAAGLLQRVTGHLRSRLNGYPEDIEAMLEGEYLMRPGLGARSGIIGALCLAQGLDGRKTKG
jgi:fructokinase